METEIIQWLRTLDEDTAKFFLYSIVVVLQKNNQDEMDKLLNVLQEAIAFANEEDFIELS